jgi:hypothetical protein
VSNYYQVQGYVECFQIERKCFYFENEPRYFLSLIIRFFLVDYQEKQVFLLPYQVLGKSVFQTGRKYIYFKNELCYFFLQNSCMGQFLCAKFSPGTVITTEKFTAVINVVFLHFLTNITAVIFAVILSKLQ